MSFETKLAKLFEKWLVTDPEAQRLIQEIKPDPVPVERESRRVQVEPYLDPRTIPSEKELRKIGGGLNSWYRNEAGFEVWLANSLSRKGVYPQELLRYSRRQILKIRTIGEVAADSIQNWQDRYYRR